MASLGFDTLAGNTRVSTANGLVRLDSFAGGGAVDAYTKAQTDALLLFKQNLLDNNVGAGSTLISGSTLRRLIGGSNVAITEDADGNLVLTAAGGGSSGIPSTIAEFLSTGITLKVLTTFNQGATCTGTLETDVIKSDSYLAKNSSSVQLLGQTEGSIACFADSDGISSIAARNRFGEQGALVTTNSALTDLVLKNNTAQRNIRLTGSTMAIGQVGSPTLYITDSSVVSTQPIDAPALSVTGHAAVQTLTSSGNAAMGTIYSNGYLTSTTLASGMEFGIVPTVNFARLSLISPLDSLSQIYMGAVSQGPNNVSRIESRPAGNGLPSAFKFYVEGSSCLELQETTSTCTTNLNVTGNLVVTGNITAPNHLAKATIESTYQPLLSSVADDNTFHTVLGTQGAANKLKAISSTSGINITSVFDSMNFQLDHLNFLSTVGFEDRNTTHTTGFTQVAAGSWGQREFKPGELRAFSANVGVNGASGDVLSFDIPAGATSAVLQHLAWVSAGYHDVYAVSATEVSVYLTRIDVHNGASTAVFGAVHSGVRIQTIACDLDSFPGGRLEIRCRKGIFHFMSLGFHDSVLPCDATSFVHSDNIYGNPSSLSDSRIKESVQPLDGATALDIVAKCGGSVYTRPDLEETRLGLIADDVQTALAGLGIDNVVGSKHAQPGDLPADQYLTLDYSRLVAVLCPAVTELSRQVAELKQQLQKKSRK